MPQKNARVVLRGRAAISEGGARFEPEAACQRAQQAAAAFGLELPLVWWRRPAPAGTEAISEPGDTRPPRQDVA